MKTLKKTLCWLLVLSMVLSLGVVSVFADDETAETTEATEAAETTETTESEDAAEATDGEEAAEAGEEAGEDAAAIDDSDPTGNDYGDLADLDQVKHQEAVQVLNGLKVITGKGGDPNLFDPTANLNRAQACALVTRLLIALDSVPEKASSFTDMADYKGMDKYVAYLESLGIVAGMGDGTFNPGGNVTYAQFAKMILCALGYDPDIEGLVGETWKINVAKLVRKISLNDQLGNLAYETELTRDDAAQLAFNGLLADMVEYNVEQSTNSDGTTSTTVNQSAGFAANTGNSDGNIAGDGVMQLGESTYPQLARRAQVNESGDLYYVWKNGTETVAEGETLTPVVTYTEKKSATDIENDLMAYTLDDASAIINSCDDPADPVVIANKAALADFTGDGIEVKLYTANDSSKDIQYISAASPYLVKITAMDKTSKSITLALQGVPGQLTTTVNTKNDNKDFYEDFSAMSKDDYVLVYANQANAAAKIGGVSANGFLIKGIIGEPEVINGSATKVTTRDDVKYVTLSGQEYKGVQYYGANNAVVRNNDVGEPYLPTDLDATYDTFLYNGYIMGVEEKAAADDTYAFVVNKYSEGTRDSSTYEARLLKNDGSVDWYTIAGSDNKTTSSAITTLYGQIEANASFVKYAEIDGGYDLTTVLADRVTAVGEDEDVTSFEITKGKINYGVNTGVLKADEGTTYKMTADTVLLTEQDDGTYTVTKGVSSIPTKVIKSCYILCDAAPNNANILMIVETSGASASGYLVFVPNAPVAGDTSKVGSTQVTEYGVIKDGTYLDAVLFDDVPTPGFYDEVYTSGSGDEEYIVTDDTETAGVVNNISTAAGYNGASIQLDGTALTGKADNAAAAVTLAAGDKVYTDGTSLNVEGTINGNAGTYTALLSSDFKALLVGKDEDNATAVSDYTDNMKLNATTGLGGFSPDVGSTVYIVLDGDSAVKYVILESTGVKSSDLGTNMPAAGSDLTVDTEGTYDATDGTDGGYTLTGTITLGNITVKAGAILIIDTAANVTATSLTTAAADGDTAGGKVVNKGTLTVGGVVDNSPDCIHVVGENATLTADTVELTGGKLDIAGGSVTVNTKLTVDADSTVVVADDANLTSSTATENNGAIVGEGVDESKLNITAESQGEISESLIIISAAEAPDGETWTQDVTITNKEEKFNGTDGNEYTAIATITATTPITNADDLQMFGEKVKDDLGMSKEDFPSLIGLTIDLSNMGLSENATISFTPGSTGVNISEETDGSFIVNHVQAVPSKNPDTSDQYYRATMIINDGTSDSTYYIKLVAPAAAAAG